MKRWIGAAAVAAVALGVFGCDGATKSLASDRLEGRPPVDLVSGVLELRYVENPGMAFNLERVLPERIRRPVLLVAGFLFLPLLVMAMRHRSSSLAELAGIALLIGGGAGNHFDRVLRGHVVDFIHVTHWPVFNVADMALAAGASLVVIAAWRAGRDRRSASPA
jgi:signal peptidase II